MAVPSILKDNLSIPVIGSPLFIISNPDLVIAQCKAGVIGSFPALNARPEPVLEEWLDRITSELKDHDKNNPDNKAAPFAVNQIVHGSNARLKHDMDMCEKSEVHIIITSLGAKQWVNDQVHGWGGIVLHDIINNRFAKSAISKGADGLIAVAAGAGGHAGQAQAMGADMGYIGSAFIATEEANADEGYKQAIVDCGADDIVYSSLFTGVHGNYLKPSIENAGLDPNNLPESDPTKMDFGSGGNTDAKAWKDIWGSGQGIGAVKARETAGEYIATLVKQYNAAKARIM